MGLLIVAALVGVLWLTWFCTRGYRGRKVQRRAGDTQTWAMSSDARFPRAPKGKRGRKAGLR